MKNLLVVSMILAGTFTGIGAASAADVTLGSYSGWQFEALSGQAR